MKLLFSLSLFILVIALPPTVFAMAATAKKTTKHAKKNKISDGTDDGFDPARTLKCDPSEGNLKAKYGCDDNDCADPAWSDGCEACMCFNAGNASWCDGSRGDYYDKYFEEHGQNPWGDDNWRNRKCNTGFRKNDSFCSAQWECANGLACCYLNNSGGGYCWSVAIGCNKL